MIRLRQTQFIVLILTLFLSAFSTGSFVFAQESPEVPPATAPTEAPSSETAPAAEGDSNTISGSSAAADPEKTDAPVPTKEVAAPVEASKVDISDSAEAQDELYSQEKLPFRYLNQYFTYDVKDGVVNLNEKAFTLNNIELAIDGKKIVFTMKEEMLAYFKKGRISVENDSGEEIAGTRFELKENNQFSVKRMGGAKLICFQIKSRYSTLKICRALSGDSNQSVKTVRANESNLGDNGQIVVQDTGDRSQFQVDFANNDKFYFETQRRKVYPATIRKQKNSEELLVRFVDLDMQTLAWEDKITIDQRYFEIKMDPLIQLRQDILFPNPKNLKAQAFAKTLIQKKQVLIITKNKFTFSTLINYSQLVANNDSLSVKLTTSMGLGGSLQYSRNFKPRWDWFTQAHFYSTKVIFDDETKTLLGKSQSLYQVSAGTIFHWKKNWDIELGAGVKTDLFLKPVNTTEGVEVFAGMNKFLMTSVQWSMYKTKMLELGLPITFRFTLPGDVGGVTANMGSRHDLGLIGNIRLSWGKIFGGFYYGVRQQNYQEFTFKENYANTYLGVTYLF